MKPELQRITATLTQLKQPSTPQPSLPDAALPISPEASCSFQITTLPESSDLTQSMAFYASTPTQEPLRESADWDANLSTNGALKSAAVLPINLPRFKPVSFSHHRHAISPALPLGLLKKIEAIVTRWERELHQVSQQIHELYQAGPIVDGWLESQPHPNATEEHTPLSHVEITRLLDSMQELLNAAPTHLVTHESPRAGYRLCRLDNDGQVQCRPCPPDKVPAISLAIARYQKLRQLLARQQLLETHLNQLAQTLVGVHGSLQE